MQRSLCYPSPRGYYVYGPSILCQLFHNLCLMVLHINIIQAFDGVTDGVLLHSSLLTSGTRVIPYTVTQGSQMECEISGCITEGWFSYPYAIPPIYHNCANMGIQGTEMVNFHFQCYGFTFISSRQPKGYPHQTYQWVHSLLSS